MGLRGSERGGRARLVKGLAGAGGAGSSLDPVAPVISWLRRRPLDAAGVVGPRVCVPRRRPIRGRRPPGVRGWRGPQTADHGQARGRSSIRTSDFLETVGGVRAVHGGRRGRSRPCFSRGATARHGFATAVVLQCDRSGVARRTGPGARAPFPRFHAPHSTELPHDRNDPGCCSSPRSRPLASTPSSQCGGCCAPEASFPLAGQGADARRRRRVRPRLGVGGATGWSSARPGYDGNKGAVFAYLRSASGWSLDGVLFPPAVCGHRSLRLLGGHRPRLRRGGSAERGRHRPRRRARQRLRLPPRPGGLGLRGRSYPRPSPPAVSTASTSTSRATRRSSERRSRRRPYFYRRNPALCAPFAWCFEDKVAPPAGLPSMEYGEAVAIDGATAPSSAAREYHVGTKRRRGLPLHPGGWWRLVALRARARQPELLGAGRALR